MDGWRLVKNNWSKSTLKQNEHCLEAIQKLDLCTFPYTALKHSIKPQHSKPSEMSSSDSWDSIHSPLSLRPSKQPFVVGSVPVWSSQQHSLFALFLLSIWSTTSGLFIPFYALPNLTISILFHRGWNQIWAAYLFIWALCVLPPWWPTIWRRS